MYQHSFKASLAIHRMCQEFPDEQYYLFTGHLIRSSQSANFFIGEGIRKKNHPEQFALCMSRANDAVAETLARINYAYSLGYISEKQFSSLYFNYATLRHTLHIVIQSPEKFFPRRK